MTWLQYPQPVDDEGSDQALESASQATVFQALFGETLVEGVFSWCMEQLGP